MTVGGGKKQMARDDYDEHFTPWDDTRCANCGRRLPADIEIVPNTPQWDGYCGSDCIDAHNKTVERLWTALKGQG